ncbi:uncharacterized protein LOC128559451 [Mercenaria mercenaria]|uniref:uncharacterized protein LOC128559451 n=1 Tax=Mercenaria mercenaria TaxID=6596 RepID=UPI00234F7CAE|nr:uncharacterized protein LOC128559451 [Mercenaria mercenaria]
MEPVVECPALCEFLLDKDVLGRTVKFQNSNFYGNVTVADVVEILKKSKISHTEVETISKGQSDKEVSVVFKNSTSINNLQGKQDFEINKKKISIVACGKQIVFVRVHWLPVYATNKLVEAMLRPFGKVISVEDSSIKVDAVYFKSGVRVAKMELSDIERAKLPHLLRFECGSKALLTVPGRPPLCLKCLTVGHYRNECYGKRQHNDDYYKVLKSFAEAAKSETGHETKKKEPSKDEQRTVNLSDTDSDTDSESETVTGKEETSVEMETASQRTKRNHHETEEEHEVQDSFKQAFPPLKTMRQSVTAASVEVSNPYSVLDGESDDLEIEDSSGEHGALDGVMDGLLDLQNVQR